MTCSKCGSQAIFNNDGSILSIISRQRADLIAEIEKKKKEAERLEQEKFNKKIGIGCGSIVVIILSILIIPHYVEEYQKNTKLSN